MGWLTFFAILAVCATVIACFGIRASHGQDVDTLEEELDILTDRVARLETSLDAANEYASMTAKRLTETAAVVAAMRGDKTKTAVSVMTGRS